MCIRDRNNRIQFLAVLSMLWVPIGRRLTLSGVVVPSLGNETLQSERVAHSQEEMGFALRDFWRSKFAWTDVDPSAVLKYLDALPNQDQWARAWADLPPPTLEDFEIFAFCF
eukprot:7397705-Karenia_brevis.AAC.1